MSIKPLSTDTIKLIKSTQVITSIFSAVKELVENSLDASAKHIEVNLSENGFKLIEVKDDGYGISKDDTEFMALPSYTSKIKDFKDIDFLTSYGFRGEGLNAICKVGEVSVLTKTSNDEIMTCYKLDHNGTIVSMEPTHGLNGTCVLVANIFKNMPVRRNILIHNKKIQLEIKSMELLLKNFAICQPKIRFTFRVNSKIIFTKLSCQTFLEAFQNVIGIQFFNKLEYINKSLDKVEISLIIPKKNLNNTETVIQNGLQFICVNERPIKSKLIDKKILKRIMEYFEVNQTNLQKFIYCITLKVDPSMLDINLEPNKDKIFLHNESFIIDQIDKLLLKYYNLQSSQDSVISNDENIPENTKNKLDLETEWPACKKRKISPLNDNLTVNITNELDFNNEFFQNFNEPILSEPESNEDEDCAKKNRIDNSLSNTKLINLENQGDRDKENEKSLETLISFPSEIEPFSIEKQGSLEIIKFPNSEEVKNIAESERLSQLPKVDLGEDFDMEDIFMNSHKILQKSKDESLINSSNNNNQQVDLESENIKSKSSHNTSNNEEENMLRWSKGQIPGLQSGMVLGNKKMLTKNTDFSIFKNDSNKSFELEEAQTSELFDYRKDVQEKVVHTDDENSPNNNDMIFEDFPEKTKFEWKDIMGKSETNKTKTLKKEGSNTVSKNTPLMEKEIKNNKNEEKTFAGDNAGYNENSILTFSKFCKEMRFEIVQENPNFTNVEVANELHNRWKNLTSEERGYYRDIAIQDLESTCVNTSSQAKKAKLEISQEDKEKNKKKFVNMLENMKSKKKDAKSQIMRTAAPWDVNIQSVTEKYKKFPNKIECIVIGPIYESFWLINMKAKILAFDVNIILKTLNIENNEKEIDVEYVQEILNKWIEQKNNYNEFYEIFDKSSFVNSENS